MQSVMPDLNELLKDGKKLTLMQSNLWSLNEKTGNHHLNFYEIINIQNYKEDTVPLICSGIFLQGENFSRQSLNYFPVYISPVCQ